MVGRHRVFKRISFLLSSAGLLLLTFCSCSVDLDVHTPDSDPIPVVYALIDPMDSVHYIRLQRSFASTDDPAFSVNNPDSLYFDDPLVEVLLVGSGGDTIRVEPVRDTLLTKDPGLFTGETHHLYAFQTPLSRNKYPLYRQIGIRVRFAGLPEVNGFSNFLGKPVVRWPYVAQQYVYMDSTRPFLVQWYGDAWNEVDVVFTVYEQYRDSTVQQAISFEELAGVVMLEGIVQVTFPYDLVADHLARSLDARKPVIRRYMGPVYVTIHTGNQDFADYMKYRSGLNDFTGQTYSNLEHAMGLIACKWTYPVRPLTFDHFTRMRFASDPRLRPFKFKEY